MKNCENCEKEHLGNYATGRFCSLKCSRSFATKLKRNEINLKVSEKLKFPIQKKRCIKCGIEFVFKVSSRKFCSKSCSGSWIMKSRWENSNSLMREIASKNAIKRHQEGDENFGWKSRNFEPSYPEKLAMEVFEELGLEYKREVKIGKWFVDFLHENVAIEIDGQQHKKIERLESDIKKDEFLKEKGFRVLRIEWIPKSGFKDEMKKIIINFK